MLPFSRKYENICRPRVHSSQISNVNYNLTTITSSGPVPYASWEITNGTIVVHKGAGDISTSTKIINGTPQHVMSELQQYANELYKYEQKRIMPTNGYVAFIMPDNKTVILPSKNVTAQMHYNFLISKSPFEKQGTSSSVPDLNDPACWLIWPGITGHSYQGCHVEP